MRNETPIATGRKPVTETPPVSAQRMRTRSRYTIAVDALRGNKPFAADACEQFFDTLLRTLRGQRILGVADGFVDDVVVDVLEKCRPLRDDFLQLSSLVVGAQDSRAMMDSVVRFFGGLLGLRRPPARAVRYNPLWCDPFTFMAREWFVNVCAIALQAERGDLVACLLDAVYDERIDGCPPAGYLRFGGYTRSLDEFRARRTGVPEPRPSAALLKERCGNGPVSFEVVMEADLVLCLRSVLSPATVPRYWLPTTIACAGDAATHGVARFRRMADGGDADTVLQALGLKNRRRFVDEYRDAAKRCRLDRWRLAGSPVPFDVLLGLDRP